MRRSSALAGIVGLIFLAFALVDYFITSGFRAFFLVNLFAGLFSIVLWLSSARQTLPVLAGQRATRYGAQAALYTLGFVVLLVAINYLGTVYHRRVDLTEEKVFSLASQSVDVVRGLKKPLKFYGFFEGGVNRQASQLYEAYTYASPMVSYELVDPDRHPELAERFKVSTMGTTHIQYGGEASNGGTNVTETNEEALTNGIIRVTKQQKKTIYFLDGHGEPAVDDTQKATGFGNLQKALEGEGFEVKKILLASQPKVPDDANIVVVAGPVRPLLGHEVKALDDYLKHGGRVIAMLRPRRPDQPFDDSGLINLVGQWGVKAGNDVVVDQVLRLFAGPALGLDPMVDNYGAHPITRDFTQRTIFPMARSVTPEGKLKDGLDVAPLAKTSDTSWAETDLEGVFRKGKAQLDKADTKGPIDVCDAVSADLQKLGWGKGTARLVVFGSTDFADNQYLNDFYNRDFFVNGADWLVGEESAISIRPRSLRVSRARLTVDQFSIVFALSVLLLPELLLIAGIMTWWERRA